MHSKILSHILNKDGVLYGGFVRDYLIRGEDFRDIDYYFNNQFANPNNRLLYINNQPLDLTSIEEPVKFIFGKEYHIFYRSYYYDLSCNLFGFDKDGFFPLPTQHKDVDLDKAWKGILNKEFYKLSYGRLSINKLITKGWKMFDETSDLCQEIIVRDRSGIWQEYNQIAFQRIKDIK
jgi:hypothetical protein